MKKKVYNIILLILAVVVIIFAIANIARAIDSLSRSFWLFPYETSLFNVFFNEYTNHYFTPYFYDIFTCLVMMVFPIIYIITILKNGLAEQIFNYAVVGIDEIKETHRKRKKARLERQSKEISAELEKIDNEESE